MVDVQKLPSIFYLNICTDLSYANKRTKILMY